VTSVPQAFRTPLIGLAWAAAAVVVGGYRFGAADHGIHLAFLDMVLHPDRWRGDLLAVAAESHHSWFSHLQAPFAEVLGPALQAGALYAICLVAIGGLLVALGETAGLSRPAAIVAAAVLAVAYDASGGAPTLDPLLLHRTAALPLELAALLVLLRGRVIPAFALCGAAVCIHAPSAVALGFGMTFGHVVLLRMQAEPTNRVGASGLREANAALLGPPAGFVLGAAPLVVPWLMGSGPRAALATVDDAWWAVLVARLPHHLVPSTWPADVWISLALWLAVAVVATLALVRHADGPRAELRALTGVAFGCFAYALSVGTVAGPVARIALGLQLEAWQASRFLILLAVIITVGSLDVLRSRGKTRFAGVLAALLLATAWSARSDEPRRFEPTGPSDAQAEIARWAAGETEEGARFLLPPSRFGAFRALALRPVVATWKDGGEATFSRETALEWRRRIERVCACSIDGGGGLPGLRERLRAGWAARTLEGIRQTAVEEGADWIVVEVERAEAPVYSAGPWAVVRAPETGRRAP